MQLETETKVYGPGRFPNPTVQTSYILSGDVENDDGSTSVHNVLSSSSGMFYKFSVVIKKAIYGLVVKGLVLRPTENGTYIRTGDVVALKVCSKDVLQRIGGVTLENPITEIGAMQDTGLPPHPNLSTQYECCMDEKNIYSVLHFYRGVELFDHILNHGRLSEPVARVVFQQLTLALFRLQQRDIAHRDVSLENIMYDASTHAAVLIDFGLCVKLRRDSEDPTQLVPVRNTACGKGYYMPPEVDWSGDRPMPINPIQSDVWSAGVCLLYALLGFPPIERACGDDVRFNYLTTGRLPELLEHWEVALSPACVDLIQMILRPDPADRPSLAQIWAHSWMRQEGLPMPLAAQLCPEEVAALLGPSASVSGGYCGYFTAGLAPLQHPLATASSHSLGGEGRQCGVDRETGEEMCVSSSSEDCDGDGDGESVGPELRPTDCTTRECDSFRSSVDSHWSWSAATTPTTRTATVTAPATVAGGLGSASNSIYSPSDHCAAVPSSSVHAHRHEHSQQPVPSPAGTNTCAPPSTSTHTTSSAASSGSASGTSSPYFTRSRAGTPRTAGTADYAHSPGGGGGPAASNGTSNAKNNSGNNRLTAGSNNSNNSGGGGGGGGVFRVIHTRSMSLGKGNASYHS